VKKVPAALTLAVLLLAAPALQAQEFYSDMLQRGISDTLRGAWAKAANELRIAAFGSIGDMTQYQTAQVYLAIVSDRLGREADARSAATKALQAERISPVYTRATIDGATRQSFEQLLPKLLTVDHYAGLSAFSRARGTSVAQAAPVPMPQPQVATPAPVPVPVSRPVPPPAPVLQPRPAPAPAPVPVKAVPQPVAPQPQPNASPLAAAARRAPSQSSHFTDFAARIAEAQRLLNEGKMIAARQAFGAVARAAEAPRSALLDAAKGLSQTDAWSDSSALYAKLFPLQKGEEPHYFYEAVNRFELGEIATARDLLHRALPYVGNSREVAAYRGRIEGTAQ
jgi:outer membrane biosynthesis protein TonB